MQQLTKNKEVYMSKISIDQSIIFITGTNREAGIGRALLEEAIKRGAKKIYATARNPKELTPLANRYPGLIVPIELDITNQDQINQAVKAASDTQILINNAGSMHFSGLSFHYNEAAAREELEVNYFGTLHLIQAFINSLIKKNNAAIVNITSIAALFSFPPAATYSASKAVTHSLTQSIRAELSRYGVSVFGVYPGPTDTDMSRSVKVPKENPKNTAIRIFDGIETGIQDITTDQFADEVVRKLESDLKAMEKFFDDEMLDRFSYLHK